MESRLTKHALRIKRSKYAAIAHVCVCVFSCVCACVCAYVCAFRHLYASFIESRLTKDVIESRLTKDALGCPAVDMRP